KHTICAFDTEYSRGGCIFQDGYTFNLIHIDLGQLFIRVFNIIHDNQGLISIRVQRTHTTDIKVGSIPSRLARTLDRNKTRQSTCKCVLHTGGRYVAYFGSFYGTDRARIGQFFGRTKSNNNDLIDILTTGLEDDFQILPAFYRSFLRDVTHTPEYQFFISD